MEGRVCIVRSPGDLSAIDKDLLNDLCHGLDIHILNVTHITECDVDRDRFETLINNNDRQIRIIFIPLNMVEQFKITESTFYEESRRTFDPCPSDPLQTFKWHCPTCSKAFYDM